MPVVNNLPRGAFGPMNVAGDVTFIRIIGGVPVIYLFDEYHPDAAHGDVCVLGNIANAHILRQAADISLVGVEGYDGGLVCDEDHRMYCMDEYTLGEIRPETLIGCAPQFAQAMQQAGLTVVGLDCRGLSNYIEVTWDHDSPEPIGYHPDQVLRTRHFLNTFFRERARLGRNGDMILNAGRNHIDRIVAMVADGSVDQIARARASYVRIRHPDYPND